MTAAAYVSTLGPGSLAMHIGRCDDRPCVSWVMPAGEAWTQGARRGMTVLSADGRALTIGDQPPLPVSPKRQAQVVGNAGEILQVVVNDSPISTRPLKFSLWLLGGAFALLGAAVMVRRPDLPSARWFALFSGSCAGALAVGPSAGGPAPPWATGVQALTFTGIGITFLPFVVELMGGISSARVQRVIRAFVIFGLGIIIAFGASVLFNTSWYSMVRPVMLLYVAGSILSGTAIVVLRAARSGSPQDRQQARIVAWGSSLGWTPFVVLTLVPQAVSGTSWLLPAHISVLPLGLVPLSFAYAIVQHQLMGVRRLVHRGMVYSIASLVLLGLVSVTLAIVPTTPCSSNWDAIIADCS